jgi:parallel beta-helix repeat protein
MKALTLALSVLLVSSAILVIVNPLVVYASSCTITYSPSNPPASRMTINGPGTFCFAAGTYNTQITIASSNVTLMGAPGTTASSVLINPTTIANSAVDSGHSNTVGAVVYAKGSARGITGVTVEGLTVTGPSTTSLIASCGTARVGYYVGILYVGASGTITGNIVNPPTPPSPVTTEIATAAAILPDVTYTTNATYGIGQDVQISTIVPSGTDPVSIQGFQNGVPGLPQGWNVAETGYNYIFNSGSTKVTGSYTYYTQVTFADGSVVQSNADYVTVQSTGSMKTPVNALDSECQGDAGVGILVGTSSGVAAKVSITQNTVVNYQKAGIMCWEVGTSCTISGNYISPALGAGATNAPNGIELMYDGTGTVTGNVVHANVCSISGVCGTDLVNQQQSCGIMTYEASSNVNMTGNYLTGDDIGICLGVDPGRISTSGNMVNGSTYAGIEVYDESQTVSGNTISNLQYGIVPISDASNFPATVHYSDTFNSVSTSCYPLQVSPGVATCTLTPTSSLGM